MNTSEDAPATGAGPDLHSHLTMPRALIVDDEESICKSLAGVLGDEGWQVSYATSGQDGLARLSRESFDVVFLDVWMPGIDGIETLQLMKGRSPELPIVIMSGHATIDTAVRATRLGAFEVLEKPLSIAKILPILDHAANLRVPRPPVRDGGPDHAFASTPTLIGNAPAIVKLRETIKIVARHNSWVLITGENGTGKEVVAQAIHAQSARVGQPFVAMNCAAIPEELIESELFGHRKGAFTGAIANKKGKFEQAHRGTLFLDEIGDMSLKTQAKVLRVLQERRFDRLGDQETISVDVRVVAATNRDLQELIAAGLFREDLFYRLNVIPCHIPPLRERDEDIEIFTKHFLGLISASFGDRPKRVSDEALEVLREYRWPGNVRELKNLVERLSVMTQGDQIDVSDLPDNVFEARPMIIAAGTSTSTSATLRQAKLDFEKSFILDRLGENQWNVTKTAESIGVERSHLHRKLRSFQIDPKRLRG